MKLNTKPLSGIETKQPVVQAGSYYARITQAGLKQQIANPSRHNLVIEVVLTEPEVTNAKGEVVENKGIRLTRHISTHGTETYEPERRYKELALAINHPAATDDSVDFEDTDLLDKDVEVIVSLKPAESGTNATTGKAYDYDERNEIVKFQAIKDASYEAPPF
jgi:hypothetical protein